jgi:hypothetical protein
MGERLGSDDARCSTQIADYSHPAADAHPRVEARRLSIRRRTDFGRCRTPVRSARAVCCLWVMSTMTHVSGISRILPVLRWPGQISGPGVLADPRCLASRDQVSTRETSRHDQLQGPAFRLRSARTCPGSSVTGPAAYVSSRSRARSCDASGQEPAAPGQGGPGQAVCAITSLRLWFGAGRGFGTPEARCRDAGGRRLGLRRGRRAR